MKTIAIINQKGGVGKSTISSNMAFFLSKLKKKILLIDLDPQAHSCELYKGSEQNNYTIKDLFTNNELHISKIIAPSTVEGVRIDNLDVIHSDIYFAKVSEQATFKIHREKILHKGLKKISNYDYVILDCPPNLGVITTNAIFAADTILIPVTYDKGALDGTADLMRTIREIKESDNFSYLILRNLFDSRNKQTNSYIEEELKIFGDKVLNTKIRRTEAINQARIAKLPIYSYDPTCNAIEDYSNLVQEVIENV